MNEVLEGVNFLTSDERIGLTHILKEQGKVFGIRWLRTMFNDLDLKQAKNIVEDVEIENLIDDLRTRRYRIVNLVEGKAIIPK